jgi:hypothetical protein
MVSLAGHAVHEIEADAATVWMEATTLRWLKGWDNVLVTEAPRRVHKCVHAACRYSCTRPPRRSRRWARYGRSMPVSASPTAGSGGCSPSARCAR